MLAPVPHPAYEPDDSERSPWAGLFIIAASFAAWAALILGGRYLFNLFTGL